MPTATKRQLVMRIWERVGGSQKRVHSIVQAFMDEVMDELGEGTRIVLRDFATFWTVRKPPRRARNPSTREQVQVRERTVIMFRPGRRMHKKAQQVKE